MKITWSFKVRSFVLVATMFACLGLATHAVAQERSYSFLIDLNSKEWIGLGGLVGVNSEARGINDSGQVVGAAPIAAGHTHAFITGPNGVQMRDLQERIHDWGGASDINNAGQVVGTSQLEGSRAAFITGPNGLGMTLLPKGDNSAASGINDAGRVVGNYGRLDPPFRQVAFITGPGGEGIADLGTLGGEAGVATAINNDGQVVGISDTASGARHAFITGPGGMGITDLGTLGGDYSLAHGVNDAGQVVGESLTANGQLHAFITGPDGKGMTGLGTLGGVQSVADDINDAGRVVGRSQTSSGVEHAFVTGPNGEGMIDLNSLVPLPSGTILTDATGINNRDQLIAISVIPEPESYAMFLAGLGLVGLMVRKNMNWT